MLAHCEIKGFAFGEIETYFFSEIKSVPQPDEVGFHREVIPPVEDGFLPPVWTALVEKGLHLREVLFLDTHYENTPPKRSISMYA